MSKQNEGDWRDALWKGAITPSIITALIAIVGGFILRDMPGLWGSALASITVVIFFSVHLLSLIHI